MLTFIGDVAAKRGNVPRPMLARNQDRSRAKAAGVMSSAPAPTVAMLTSNAAFSLFSRLRVHASKARPPSGVPSAPDTASVAEKARDACTLSVQSPSPTTIDGPNVENPITDAA